MKSRKVERSKERRKRLLGLLCSSGGYRTVILQAVLDRNIENGAESIRVGTAMSRGTMEESARLLQETPAGE